MAALFTVDALGEAVVRNGAMYVFKLLCSNGIGFGTFGVFGHNDGVVVLYNERRSVGGRG